MGFALILQTYHRSLLKRKEHKEILGYWEITTFPVATALNLYLICLFKFLRGHLI